MLNGDGTGQGNGAERRMRIFPILGIVVIVLCLTAPVFAATANGKGTELVKGKVTVLVICPPQETGNRCYHPPSIDLSLRGYVLLFTSSTNVYSVFTSADGNYNIRLPPDEYSVNLFPCNFIGCESLPVDLNVTLTSPATQVFNVTV
jgi:hypothetical protein